MHLLTMASHRTIPNFRYRLAVVVAGLLVAILLAGHMQFRRHAIINTIYWSGDASDVTIRLDPANDNAVRYLFIPHTPYGRHQVESLLATHHAALTVHLWDLYYSSADSKRWLRMYSYLDIYAYAELTIGHYLDRMAGFFHPTSSRDIPVAASLDVTPLFTSGFAQKPDNNLVNQLRFLLQHAAAGSDARLSVFLFYYQDENEPLLLDLLAAAARGVNVQLLVDLPEQEFAERRTAGQQFADNFRQRLATVAHQGGSDSWIRPFITTSLAKKNHTKFFMFSDSAGEKNWLIVSSENLTDREREKFQAAVVFRHAALYPAFTDYWSAIRDGTFKQDWMARQGDILSSFFFPTPGIHDPVLESLDQMQVSPANELPGRISLVMSRWTIHRYPLALKLVDLANQGFAVDIVMRSNEEIVEPGITSLFASHPNIHLYTTNVSDFNIHSKYLLYDGYIRTDTGEAPVRRRILWTGSHNFTGMGLGSNYETWVYIRDDSMYRAFSDNFQQLEKLIDATRLRP